MTSVSRFLFAGDYASCTETKFGKVMLHGIVGLVKQRFCVDRAFAYKLRQRLAVGNGT